MTAIRRTAAVRRALDGVGWVVVVWAAWRVAHLLLSLANGADPLHAVYTFDGEWYRKILEHGYSVTDPTFHRQQNVAFFPGVVWLAAPFKWLFGPLAAAHITATITSLSAFVGVHLAAGAVTDDAVAARRAVLALAIWPTSMVMTAFYSEGLFITATTVGIWALRRDRAAVAATAGLVAAVTRSIGVLLGPALAVGRVIATRRVDRVAVLYAVTGPAGLAAVALVQRVTTGQALGFVDAQRAWNRELAGPWEAVRNAVSDLTRAYPNDDAYAWAINLIVVAALAVGLAWLTRMVWRGRDQLTEPAARAAWIALLVWGWVAWYSTLLTSTMAAATRFVLGAWPIFVAVGLARSPGERRVVRVLAVASYVLAAMVIRPWAGGRLNPLYT